MGAPRELVGVPFDLHATRCAALLPLIRGGASNAATDPIGSEARRFAASDLWTGRELGARGADATGTSRLGSTSHLDTPLERIDSSGSPPTGTPSCVGSPRPNSPWRPKVARREAASFGPDRVRGPRSRRSLELAAATRRSALRVDRKERGQLPAAPMPILAPGEAGHPIRNLSERRRYPNARPRTLQNAGSLQMPVSKRLRTRRVPNCPLPSSVGLNPTQGPQMPAPSLPAPPRPWLYSSPGSLPRFRRIGGEPAAR